MASKLSYSEAIDFKNDNPPSAPLVNKCLLTHITQTERRAMFSIARNVWIEYYNVDKINSLITAIDSRKNNKDDLKTLKTKI